MGAMSLFLNTPICIFSGFSSAEQPCGGVSGAGAATGGACDGRGGDDPRPDSSV